MFDIHKTKDGGTLLIAQMENSHLINMIRLLCKNIVQARSVIEQAGQSDIMMATLSEYKPEDTIEDAKLAIKYSHQKLQPYVLEAALRDLPVSQYLRVAYQRSEPIPKPDFSNLALLESGHDEYEYEEEPYPFNEFD